MHKLAVFVEGYTELLFVDRLISEICGENIVTEHCEIIGGGKNKKIPRVARITKAAAADHDKRFFILIYDCRGDRQVAARIQQEHEPLTRAGFSKIIGIRDVFPDYLHADIPKLERLLKKYIKTSLIPVEFILPIMELEAWFLAEFNHFAKINSSITTAEIKSKLGFDPEHDDLSLRLTPTEDLNSAYMLGGKSYVKGVDSTIKALDYPFLYVELTKKIPYLNRLGMSIDDFFDQA